MEAQGSKVPDGFIKPELEVPNNSAATSIAQNNNAPLVNVASSVPISQQEIKKEEPKKEEIIFE